MNDYNKTSSTYEGYEELSIASYQSPVITGLKGLLGAVIGALPGMLLWIILGKIGYIAAAVGLLMAAGIIYGYTFMTKDNELPAWATLAICLGVMIIGVYMAERICWTWEIAELFKEQIPLWKEDVMQSIQSEFPDYTRSEIEEILGANWIDEAIEEEIGFTEPTFGNCFANFGHLLEWLEVKSDFTISLVKSYAFAIFGGLALFAKKSKGAGSV